MATTIRAPDTRTALLIPDTKAAFTPSPRPQLDNPIGTAHQPRIPIGHEN